MEDSITIVHPDDNLPHIHSTPQDLRMEGRPKEDPFNVCGYMDSSWGDCPLTRRSTGGHCLRLAGGLIAWKGRLWPTVAHSSTDTEAEYLKMMMLVDRVYTVGVLCGT